MARGSTLNVSLTTALERYVQEKVDSGDYESASEVIRESLRVSKALDHHRIFWSNAREKVRAAREQVAQGKVLDGESAMDQLADEAGSPSPAKKRSKPAKRNSD